MGGKVKAKTLKQLLDKSASYVWIREADGYYRLYNQFTLKSACGFDNRIDAEKTTQYLKESGFAVGEVPGLEPIK